MGKHETSIYRKVIITFTVILLGVLILVGAVVNRFCMSFIKEQRITYNTQVLGEVEYEFKELYADESAPDLSWRDQLYGAAG